MEIDVSTQQGRVLVTVVKPHGDLDGSNYTELIDQVRKLVAEGTRDIAIDLSEVPFMSSAGLMALQSAALLLRGEKVPSLEAGKAAVKSMHRGGASGFQQHIKLLKPNECLTDIFDKVGFMQHFQVFSDVQQAVASF